MRGLGLEVERRTRGREKVRKKRGSGKGGMSTTTDSWEGDTRRIEGRMGQNGETEGEGRGEKKEKKVGRW